MPATILPDRLIEPLATQQPAPVSTHHPLEPQTITDCMIRSPFQLLLVSLLTATPLLLADPITLSRGHVDIGIAYEEDHWHLHVHVEEPHTEFAPDQVIFLVPGHTATPIPQDPRYAFLGQAGSLVWVLPEAEDHDHDHDHDHSHQHTLFLGLAAEEVESGVFADDQVTLTLRSVAGPGHFFLYHTDALGNPVVSMNSADGIDSSDSRVLMAGSHAHANWAFSAPGTYRIGFQASGTLAASGSPSSSDLAEFVFHVEHFPLLKVTMTSPQSLALQWLSREHHEYRVESTADPGRGPWISHPGIDPIEGDGASITLEVPVGDQPRFFRLAIDEESGHDHHHD